MRVSWDPRPLEASPSPRGPTREPVRAPSLRRGPPPADPRTPRSLWKGLEGAGVFSTLSQTVAAGGRGTGARARPRRPRPLRPSPLAAWLPPAPLGPSSGRCAISVPHVPLSSRSTPPLRGTGPSAAHRAPQGSRPRASASTSGWMSIHHARPRRRLTKLPPACLLPALNSPGRPGPGRRTRHHAAEMTGRARATPAASSASRAGRRTTASCQRPPAPLAPAALPPQAAGPSAPAWTGRGDLAPLSTSTPAAAAQAAPTGGLPS